MRTPLTESRRGPRQRPAQLLLDCKLDSVAQIGAGARCPKPPEPGSAQLFLNWKLKSVAHLPWRQMSYKFLNTIIDDLFAFVIKACAPACWPAGLPGALPMLQPQPCMHRWRPACFAPGTTSTLHLLQCFCHLSAGRHPMRSLVGLPAATAACR